MRRPAAWKAHSISTRCSIGCSLRTRRDRDPRPPSATDRPWSGLRRVAAGPAGERWTQPHAGHAPRVRSPAHPLRHRSSSASPDTFSPVSSAITRASSRACAGRNAAPVATPGYGTLNRASTIPQRSSRHRGRLHRADRGPAAAGGVEIDQPLRQPGQKAALDGHEEPGVRPRPESARNGVG